MGVTGLWRLIEPAGKPVPVETLENKVLAVDISIWLHQMVKGYQDAKGAPIANAHLMGLFQRLCKLLYFRIRPVFVFDGAFPQLKRETIARRQDSKQKYHSESERIKRELALLLTKKTALGTLLGKQISPTKKSNKDVAQSDDDLFKLPALPQREEESESEESETEESSSSSIIDLHSMDLESDKFKNLPMKEKYEILIELQETRKQNSWGKLHELPKKSDNFSDFQMQRLLKRRKLQECLHETEKEMGEGGMSLNDLESLLNDEGIDTKIESLPTRRIASDNKTRFLLINNVKEALANAKKRQEAEINEQVSKSSDANLNSEEPKPKNSELEEDLEKAIKMSMECVNEADTSACYSKTDDSWTSCLSDTDYTSDKSDDSEENDGYEAPDMSSAKAYIMQYSDFTEKAIKNIVTSNRKSHSKNKKGVPKVNAILEEIYKEKSVIVDEVDISSSEEECIDNLEEQKEARHMKNDDKTTEQLIQSNDDYDNTQASVVCVENTQNVVTLDSSTEESSAERAEGKALSPKLVEKDESDSSEDDFEDVPEAEPTSKTVVQLTLNMNDEIEDDIFADVFTHKEQNVKTSELPFESEKGIVKSEPVFDDYVNEIEDEDDELQRAIKMSLECVTDKEVTTVEPAEIEEIKVYETTATSPKQIEEPKETVAKPKGLKTLESLHIIQSTELSETNPKRQDKNHEVPTVPSDENDKVISTKETPKEPVRPITTEELNEMVEEINAEEQDLVQEKGKMDRIGRNITEEMTKDAQELLQLFGIPYIVAPMEAEAQCAFLESVKLTDGTITDDSDIWLFGGKNVYKNFFNQKKHVLQFLSDRIERSFNLSREQLILLALLVGSDYTTGVPGVGPVTALEVLASFPFNKRKLLNETSKQEQYAQILTGLQEFKQWVRSGKRTDNTTLKKKLRNVQLTDDFPSVRVVQAYLEPNVEKSEDKFTWGEIDVNILRNYTKKKFGWSQHKLDEIIKPVLKRLTESKTQKTLQNYFKTKGDNICLEDQMSKRVKAAVQKMGPEPAIEEQPEETEENSSDRKRKANKGKGKKSEKAGPSKAKQKKTEESVLKEHSVKVMSVVKDGKSDIDIQIRKTDRFQEIIPQREKDKQSLLQNKLKAIEVFRKSNIDKKKKLVKRKPIMPKQDAELSESSDSN